MDHRAVRTDIISSTQADGATVERTARLYLAYAAASLAVTVLAGSWLRAVLVHPPLLGGLDVRHAVHAHSHLALFGWATMALLALVVRTGRPAHRWLRWHAHAVGLASAAAFVGFLMVGYAPVTIGIATLHVALWIAFALGSWRSLAAGPDIVRRYLRAALCLLVVAGVGAMTPGIVRARGPVDPWLSQLAVELFLAPYIVGWLGLGVAGALYARLKRPRHHGRVIALLAAGAVPSALFRVTAAAPAAWLPVVGRVGMLCVGLGMVLLALDVLRAPRPMPLLRLAGLFALLEGAAEIGVAVGAGASLLGNHQVKVAYLHLVLLGVVTPALLGTAVLPALAVRRLALVHAAGLLLTLAALVALGLADVARLAAAAGLSGRALLAVALAGGALSAAALLGMLAVAWRRGDTRSAATAARRPREDVAAA
jgi:hypothetical protein